MTKKEIWKLKKDLKRMKKELRELELEQEREMFYKAAHYRNRDYLSKEYMVKHGDA